MNKKYLAIDIGGTSIKVAIVTDEGKLLDKKSYPTPQNTYKELLATIKNIVSYYKNHHKLLGIGFAIPAATDSVNGIIKSKGSLIYIKNQRLKDK